MDAYLFKCIMEGKFRNLYFGLTKKKIKSKKFAGKRLLTSKQTNTEIYNLINSEKPFMVARYGSVELSVIRDFILKNNGLIKDYSSTALASIKNNAGVFSADSNQCDKFSKLMLSASSKIDLLGAWFNELENYVIKKYGNQMQLCQLRSLEPWSFSESPWSAALKGKKVLVIHPFEETIKSQYARREKIFPGTDILPEFELKTLKAVQTIAGEKDERFETWFDALEWMYEEALKIDFDVAIIGCGAYGLPLAAKLKEAGKQAIHLGGVTQILFGIMGKRWESENCVKVLINDSWVYPREEDIPKNSKSVEGGCYWR